MYRVYWNQVAAPFLSFYLFSVLSLQFSKINIFFSHFFSETVRPLKLTLDAHVNNGRVYRVYHNQAAVSYLFLCSLFLTLQCLKI